MSKKPYRIVSHPTSKIRFAQVDGMLIPNQGNMPSDAKAWTDVDIEANYQHYLERNR